MGTIKQLIYLLVLTLTIPGCSDKSSPVNDESSANISVFISNEIGEPIEGAVITTNPETVMTTTDINGRANISNVFPRSYSVIVHKTGCPTFNKYIILDSVSTVNVSFTIFTKMNIIIKDEIGRSVIGAQITTNPATQTVTTDSEGVTVLSNVPERTYQFTIDRPGLPPINTNYIIDQANSGEIEFIITSEAPVVSIIKPSDNQVTSPLDVTLEGVGTDHEDGELPETSLVWTSSIDGEIGTGTLITVENFSLGTHTIRLRGTDTDNKQHVHSIYLTVVDYDPNSYFPILENTTWEYRHYNPTFFAVNENNVNEFWEMSDLVIEIDDKNSRISTIYYDITVAAITKHVKYTLIDNFEVEDNNLFVTSTSEKLIEWSVNNEESNPNLTITVETEYSPSYLILKNITNPTAEPVTETVVRATTEWIYINFNTVSSTYHESYKLETTIKTGDSKLVQTDKGFFQAIGISFTTSDSSKKWWLTRGVGLVQINYTISDFDHTAVLSESDLLSFYRDKPALTKKVPLIRQSTPAKVFHISRETGEGFRELRNYLRAMCP